mmetsp:Transcript_6766/g.12201  ORF Transcript_6766/g.12201 Transcript_6766/m.12201 type:complete len:337 (+) Transcript_6766:60-1070(+)|eukprot:CAMPEP_0182497874 /NCGR_PEP_ID=MMETSP1321-20130603/6257_1 /TAXON_ID=91990 /ORGANISM="Bolidomonas sp., Strain RCC1657" /LENGTH=336 /DNA_ID=CAMNT_0024701849 /DNA_START=58 /DNA_END=1068 /DNA_ORIENTATION=-
MSLLSNLTETICVDEKAGDFMSVAQPCPFPTIYPGYGGDTSSAFTLECSKTYADVAFSDHTTKCIIYLVLALIVWTLCLYGYILARRLHLQKSIQGKCTGWGCIGGLPLTLACIDIDAHADRLPYVVYHLLCSIPGICLIICVISVNAYMMKSLKEKGASDNTGWDKMRKFSEAFVWTTEVSCVLLENLVEEGTGVVNGTLQALRNLLTAMVLLVWMVACIYNGLLIVKKLDSKDTSAQKAQNQVLFYIKMLTFGSFIGFAAKVLSVFNIGKTLYARPPCEGDGFVHFNHVQLTFLMSLVPIICLPKLWRADLKSKSKVTPSGVNTGRRASTTVDK